MLCNYTLCNSHGIPMGITRHLAEILARSYITTVVNKKAKVLVLQMPRRRLFLFLSSSDAIF